MSKRYIFLVSGLTMLIASALIVLVLVLLPRVSQKSSAQDTTVRLEIFSPLVLVKLPSKDSWVEAKDNQEIPVGSQIKTNETARAQLVYPKGTVTRLDFNTEITLKESINLLNNKIKIGLTHGRVWSRIVKLLGNETYQTETNTLIASVRGTSYGHGILADGQNQVIVTKSEVAVQCLTSNATVAVKQGDLTTSDCQSVPQVRKLTKNDKTVDDQWVMFNLDEDEKVEDRFGNETYNDKRSGNVNIKKVKNAKGEEEFDYAEITDSTGTPEPTKTPKPKKKDNPATAEGPTPTPTFTPIPTPRTHGNSRPLNRL